MIRRRGMRTSLSLLVVPAALTLSPAVAGARVVSFGGARAALRATDLTTPIWFPAALSPPFHGRPLQLTIGPGDRYFVRIDGRASPDGRRPIITFGRLLVYLVDVRAFCLARGGHWQVRTTPRHRFDVCTEGGARSVYFLRSNRLYDVSTGVGSTAIGERALRHVAAEFGPL